MYIKIKKQRIGIRKKWCIIFTFYNRERKTWQNFTETLKSELKGGVKNELEHCS